MGGEDGAAKEPKKAGRKGEERAKRKLGVVDEEIYILEREKGKMKTSRALIDVERDEELKRLAQERVRRADDGGSSGDPGGVKRAKPEKARVTADSLCEYNQLTFEMENLPLEYILGQSTKIVLTPEWLLALLEKEWVSKAAQIKKAVEEGRFLKQRTRSKHAEEHKEQEQRMASEASSIREESLDEGYAGDASDNENNAQSNSLAFREKLEQIAQQWSSVAAERRLPEPSRRERESTYRELLDLFSLMKANKSSVRFVVPQSKKGAPAVHASHAACIDKIRAEVGKMSTVAELAKYRIYKKALQSTEPAKPIHLTIHKTKKHGLAIPYQQTAKSHSSPAAAFDPGHSSLDLASAASSAQGKGKGKEREQRKERERTKSPETERRPHGAAV